MAALAPDFCISPEPPELVGRSGETTLERRFPVRGLELWHRRNDTYVVWDTSAQRLLDHQEVMARARDLPLP